MVGGQKIALGRAHQHQTVTVLVSENTWRSSCPTPTPRSCAGLPPSRCMASRASGRGPLPLALAANRESHLEIRCQVGVLGRGVLAAWSPPRTIIRGRTRSASAAVQDRSDRSADQGCPDRHRRGRHRCRTSSRGSGAPDSDSYAGAKTSPRPTSTRPTESLWTTADGAAAEARDCCVRWPRTTATLQAQRPPAPAQARTVGRTALVGRPNGASAIGEPGEDIPEERPPAACRPVAGSTAGAGTARAGRPLHV